jgi:outer membrane protein TolC
LARDQVAAAAALAYLEALRTNRAVSAAQADFSLSDSLWKLARDQHAAGIASGVDVARAETERARQNLRLIRAQVSARDADIRLKRVIGLPLDQAVDLQELPRLGLGEVPQIDEAIGLAVNHRAELRISRGLLEQNRRLLRAAGAQFLPTLRAVGDYGYSGTTPSNTARTGSIGGRLSLPIFAGGERKGDILEARGRYDQTEARAEDLKIQVETDVRLALQELSASTEETRTAEQALKLAQTELKMARDRYSAGVGDNIQVLSAQASLAGAEDDQVTALAHYDVARANLAAALGRIQELR